ncbi:T9SS type A sorting domain-containing protein, partial [Candidatus Poribacteria bacterium]|nr:T9SS type A sorting domain-containing protein [Candidatus Poribacteria bacterium]
MLVFRSDEYETFLGWSQFQLQFQKGEIKMKIKLTFTLFILFCLIAHNGVAQDFPYISLRGHGTINSIAFPAESGSRLVTGDFNAYIIVWDANTGIRLRTMWNGANRDGTGENRDVHDLAFSPNGELVASAGEDTWNDYTIRLWEVSTGQMIWQRRADSVQSNTVAFSPDGKVLASGGYGNEIDLWEVSTGNSIRTLIGHTGLTLYDVAFSPDGQHIASASGDNTVKIWEAATGRHRHTLIGHTDAVYSIAFTPDSTMLASASKDTTIRLWDVNLGRHIRTFTGHTEEVFGVSISPDGMTLASGSKDKTIRLWEVSTGRHLHTLIGHGQSVHSLAFNPKNGRQLASGHFGSAVLLWELPKTHFRLRPESVVLPPIGRQFSVNLHIEDGEKVRGYKVDVTFDPKVLRYVKADYFEASYFPPRADAFYAPPVVSGESEDVVTLSATYVVSSGSTSGDGKLARLTFEVVDDQASFIDISDVQLIGSQGELHDVITHSAELRTGLPEDVNDDKSVDIRDLVKVASCFGLPLSEDCASSDANMDGVIDIRDLVQVAAAFRDRAPAAPLTSLPNGAMLSRSDVEKWITAARLANLTDPRSERGIRFLQQLLVALTPKETALLANYPNPFNPETWIPYQLATPADVTVTVYDTQGRVVRTLNLGHQAAGIYENRFRAAYWDGRNTVDEPVASGVYFYTLSTESTR